jgi:hypothetical protein
MAVADGIGDGGMAVADGSADGGTAIADGAGDGGVVVLDGVIGTGIAVGTTLGAVVGLDSHAVVITASRLTTAKTMIGLTKFISSP